MNTHSWQTDSMLAGLTRGLWMGIPVARRPRDSAARSGSTDWPTPPDSAAARVADPVAGAADGHPRAQPLRRRAHPMKHDRRALAALHA
jgi:hypothetical protein